MPRHRARLGHAVATAVSVMLVVVSCAPALTLNQEITWDAYKTCLTEGPTTQLDQVRQDGGWHVTGRDSEVYRVSDCMVRYWRETGVRRRAEATSSAAGAVTVSPQPQPRGDATLTDATPDDVVSAPTWRIGDEWTFRVESPGRTRTLVWSVDAEDVIDGVECYVVRSSRARRIYYRKQDLAFAQETLDGALDVRATPPDVRYVWPLGVARAWDSTYSYERVKDRETEELLLKYEVRAKEIVSVPAGSFETFHIIRRNGRTGVLDSDFWYAPAVKQWARWRQYLAAGVKNWELIAYRLAP